MFGNFDTIKKAAKIMIFTGLGAGIIILIVLLGYSIFYPSFDRLDENLFCFADPFREFKIFCIDFDKYQHMTKLR